MARNMKDKLGDAAKAAENKIAQGAEKAVNFVKEKTGIGCTKEDKGVAGIEEHMDVICSCGKKVGVVDHLESNAIKLTKNDSPDGKHHFIPVSWVDHVDNHVHLSKSSEETTMNWMNAPAM